jgi:hypothetical protein
MSRTWIRVVLPLVAASCIENNFGQTPPPPPEANPPDLANPTQTDVIVQVTTPMVDILWIIDNSCSMADEQNELTENIPLFMDYFLGSGLDYHVGVVSTDLDDPSESGKLQDGGTPYKFIDAETPNAIAVYTSMASMGTSGSGNEKGIGAGYLALETYRETFNANFFRDEAALHTIVVSDESDNTQDSLITQTEFVKWYDGLKEETDQRTYSSIVDPNVGGAYVNATAEIGGIFWDLHANDNFAAALDLLGVQAAGLKREYFLSQIPVQGTITVTVQDPSGAEFDFFEAEGDPPVGDWVYDPSRNSITFLEYLPAELAKVIITYVIQSSLQEGVGGGNESPATP